MQYIYFLVPLVAFITGRLALRIIRCFAIAIGFVDKPDSRRKLHESPIPLGGGLAVWVASWLGWGAGVLGLTRGDGNLTDGVWFSTGLAVASFLTLVLGLIDDRIGLRGGHKLAGQLVAAAILVGLGFRVEAIGGFGVAVELGVLAIPVTIFWIILVVNAFNLIDGMDGFCGSVGFVAALGLALLSYSSGRPGEALVGLAIAGALAAFLKDNLPPARVYLGDAGSMTLGLMISALSIRACSDGPGTAVSIPALLALLALPLLDVLTALGRRWLTGRSLFTPDRGHLHHRLRSRLGGTPAALGVAVGLAMIGACGAMLAKTLGFGDYAAGLAIVISVLLLVGTNTFGGSELRLLLYRLRPHLTGFLTSRSGRKGVIRYECHLLGSRDWTGLWGDLLHDVESADFHHVELVIEMPAAGETYHGLWTISKDSGGLPDWSIVHSFHVGGNQAGTLRVAGSADATRTQYLEKVEELVRDLEVRLEEEMGWALGVQSAKDNPPAIIPDPVASPRFEPNLV
jgi:UDP-GlcNAc:undecaprenyl-phosphate/decaprenyl-phosphate GlcNAc-1-phosphate transferase